MKLIKRFSLSAWWKVRLARMRFSCSRAFCSASLLTVGVAAFPIVRQITRRLERLQRGVESLGAGDLEARVAVEGHDEVAQLAESFNRAAGQIELLVQGHKALLANASHELRTPLARIRLAVELMKSSADPKLKLGLEQDIAELDWLVDEILLASRLDATPPDVATDEVDSEHQDGEGGDGQGDSGGSGDTGTNN